MIHTRLHTILLLLGLFTGAALAGYQAVTGSPTLTRSADKDTAARVNGRPITNTELDAVLEAIATEQPNVDKAELRNAVLHRLIDEELLVQHALETGIAERDRQARSALIGAMMATRRAEAALRTLDDEALMRYYQEHAERFSAPEKLLLRAVAIDQPKALEKARKLLETASATEWGALAKRSDIHELSIPSSPLPADKLANYVGAKLATAATRLDVGEISLVEQSDGVIMLQVLDREQQQLAFEEVRDAVQAAARRSIAERSLQSLISSLRSASEIEVREHTDQ